MSISWIKYEKDMKSFKILENFGLNVNKLKDIEEIDEKIEEMVKKNYTTIIISNQVASASQNIIKKYKNNKDINIIITPRND